MDNVTLWCVPSPIENIVAAIEVQILVFGVSLHVATESVCESKSRIIQYTREQGRDYT